MSDGDARIDEALAACGLLFVQDKRWPSVVSLTVDGDVRGSWWSHPRGKEVFNLLNRLEARDDVLFVKLLDGKVNLVHRALWPAILGVACARAPWQTDGLPAGAKTLLALVRRDGPAIRATGADAKLIDARLLARVRQVHTASGAHAFELEAWPAWAARHDVASMSAAEGMALLEDVVAHGCEAFGARLALPWSRP